MVEKSDTKMEALLNILGNGGDASPYRGSGNTKVENYILDAIDRIENLQPGGGKTLSPSDYNWNSQTYDTTAPLDSVALWLLDEGSYSVQANTKLSLSSEDITSQGIFDPTIEHGAHIYKVEISVLPNSNKVVKISDNAYYGIGTTTTILDSTGLLTTTIHTERYANGGSPDGFYGNPGDVFIQTDFSGIGRMYILEEVSSDPETGDTTYNWRRV